MKNNPGGYGSVLVLKKYAANPDYRLDGSWYGSIMPFICEMRQVTSKSYTRLDNKDIVQ